MITIEVIILRHVITIKFCTCNVKHVITIKAISCDIKHIITTKLISPTDVIIETCLT